MTRDEQYLFNGRAHRLEEYRARIAALESELAAAREDKKRLVEALEAIRGPLNEPDEHGLIEDTACCYCDASSLDGCDEDCPREVAMLAIDAARKADNGR